MKLYFLHVGNVHCFLYLGNKKQYRDVHKRKKVSYGPQNTDINFSKNQYINEKVCKKAQMEEKQSLVNFIENVIVSNPLNKTIYK